MTDPWAPRRPVAPWLAAAFAVFLAARLSGLGGADTVTVTPVPYAPPTPAPEPVAVALVAEVPEPEPDPAGGATAAVRAWQNADVDARGEALARTATPDYAAAIAPVDPAVIPDARPVEAVTTIDHGATADVRVTLDDGTVLIARMVEDGTRWRMASLVPLD